MHPFLSEINHQASQSLYMLIWEDVLSETFLVKTKMRHICRLNFSLLPILLLVSFLKHIKGVAQCIL